MFGTNPVVGPRPLEQGYLVKKIFYTVQGEGPFAGRPAIFVRFSGCNLRCTFCDTDFQGGEEYDLAALAEVLWEKMEEHSCPLLVFTGGEPMLQEVLAIAERLAADWHEGTMPAGRSVLPCPHVQIETAGTVWPEWPRKDEPCYDMYLNDMFGFNDYVTLVCSPKTPKVHSLVAEHCRHWKYIIQAGKTSAIDGLPVSSTQKPGAEAHIYRAIATGGGAQNAYKDIIYAQPCDEYETNPVFNEANIKEAVRVSMKYGYILSIQIHKIAGVE